MDSHVLLFQIQVLYSSDSWIYSYNVEKHKVSPVVHVGKVDEMDYDPANNIIYWSSRHRMARSFLPGAKDGWVTVGYPQMVGPTSEISRAFYCYLLTYEGYSLRWALASLRISLLHSVDLAFSFRFLTRITLKCLSTSWIYPFLGRPLFLAPYMFPCMSFLGMRSPSILYT